MAAQQESRFRSERFVMNDELRNILQMVRHGSRTIGIRGLGGIGKSALAAEVATAALAEGLADDSFRFPANSGAELADHASSARRFVERLADRYNTARTFESVAEALRERAELIIVEDVQKFPDRADLIKDICDLVVGTNTILIFTSRDAFSDEGVREVPLNGLDRCSSDELVRFFGKDIALVAKLTKRDFEELFETTLGIPLLLSFFVRRLRYQSIDEVVRRSRTPDHITDAASRRVHAEICEWSWLKAWTTPSSMGGGVHAGAVLTALASVPEGPAAAVDIAALMSFTRLTRTQLELSRDLLLEVSLVELVDPTNARKDRRLYLHPVVRSYVLTEVMGDS